MRPCLHNLKKYPQVPKMARAVFFSAFLALAAGLTACNSLNPFSAPAIVTAKPAELQNMSPSSYAVRWSLELGAAKNAENARSFAPMLLNGVVYAASYSGTVLAANATTGATIWRAALGNRLSAGVGSDGNTTVVATSNGELIALDNKGSIVWRSALSQEVLSPPLVAQGVVIARASDQRITALDATNGKKVWSISRASPALTLHAGHAMVALPPGVVAGFSTGKLGTFALANGALGWETTLGDARGGSEIERIADIMGTPAVVNNLACASSYQGKIACAQLADGQLVWSQPFSTLSGVAADSKFVFAPDSKSVLHAFNTQTGMPAWKNDSLQNRKLSQPASSGRGVAVADYQGYVHFFAREDGKAIGHVATDGSAITAPLLATDAGVVVQTSAGRLALLAP